MLIYAIESDHVMLEGLKEAYIPTSMIRWPLSI